MRHTLFSGEWPQSTGNQNWKSWYLTRSPRRFHFKMLKVTESNDYQHIQAPASTNLCKKHSFEAQLSLRVITSKLNGFISCIPIVALLIFYTQVSLLFLLTKVSYKTMIKASCSFPHYLSIKTLVTVYDMGLIQPNYHTPGQVFNSN